MRVTPTERFHRSGEISKTVAFKSGRDFLLPLFVQQASQFDFFASTDCVLEMAVDRAFLQAADERDLLDGFSLAKEMNRLARGVVQAGARRREVLQH